MLARWFHKLSCAARPTTGAPHADCPDDRIRSGKSARSEDRRHAMGVCRLDYTVQKRPGWLPVREAILVLLRQSPRCILA